LKGHYGKTWEDKMLPEDLEENDFFSTKQMKLVSSKNHEDMTSAEMGQAKTRKKCRSLLR
jgi:hypothetical protein